MEVRSVKRIGRWEEWGDSAPRRQWEKTAEEGGAEGACSDKDGVRIEYSWPEFLCMISESK